MNINNNSILELSKKISDEIINHRRNLHKIPELNLTLPKTSAYIQEVLTSLNIPFTTLVQGNAIVGLIKGKEGGKTIALRADMDALPIKEETNLSFTSTNENMHACGHDGHMASLIGAAVILNDLKDSFKGNIKLIFQPGEEYPGGAKPMIEEGALLNPKVDGIISMHLGHLNPEVKKGNIGIIKGPAMASMDRFLIKVIGKGGHGAYPESLVDPIVISAEIVTSLQRIISREIATTEHGLISICRIMGGNNQNILPDFVELEGTVRTTDNKVREFISRRIKEISQGIARTYGGDAEVTYDFKYPPVINDDDFTDKFYESAKKILPIENIQILKKPIMGGEDIAFFLEKVPGTFFFLANPKEVQGKTYSHHNSKFDLDEEYLHIGSALLVQGALDYLFE